MRPVSGIHLLLLGTPGTELRLAAAMARDAGAEVTMADTAAQALSLLRTTSLGLVMIDVETDVAGFMGQLRAERFAVPVLACGVNASADRAVAAIRAGARDYVPLPPQRELIAAAIASYAEAGSTARLLGQDAGFARASVFALAMAQARVPMLIEGEKGCGKEAMARAIHQASGRPGRFLVVECCGVGPEVVESELFGHEAGAFPGAVAKRLGRIEKAADGTLLLRDIDCLPATLQAKVLAVLQEGGLRRLGGHDVVPVSARLIASTHRDLNEAVEEGRFRADLLARLAVARIPLPALRDREGDVVLLAEYFAEKLALANGLPVRPFTADALELLAGYDWPGNVRELEDVVHRAVLLTHGDEIGPAGIVLVDGAPIAPASAASPVPGGRIEVEALVGRTVEEVERELILQTLEHCQGNRTCASSILGISVRTMRNKL